MAQLFIVGDIRKGGKVQGTMNLLRTDLGLFRSLVEKVPWEAVLVGK